MVKENSEDIDLVRRYLQEIRRYPLLKEQEGALVKELVSFRQDLLLESYSYLAGSIVCFPSWKRKYLGECLKYIEGKEKKPKNQASTSLTKEQFELVSSLDGMIQKLRTDPFSFHDSLQEKIYEILLTVGYKPDKILKETAKEANLITRLKKDLASRSLEDVLAALNEFGNSGDINTVANRFSLLSVSAEKYLASQQFYEYTRLKQRFATVNLRLVVSVAKRYSCSGLPLLDLIQEGNIGMMSAIDKFDPQRGNKFSSCAMWWIRQAITSAIADKVRTIRIPVTVREKLKKYNAASTELFSLLGRDPTNEEVAEMLEISLPQLRDLILINQHRITISLDCLVGKSGDDTLGDFIPEGQWVQKDGLMDYTTDFSSKDHILAQELHQQILPLLASLSPQEEAILRRLFGIGFPVETLQHIGDDPEFGMSRERIRQIKEQALLKLSKIIRERIPEIIPLDAYCEDSSSPFNFDDNQDPH